MKNRRSRRSLTLLLPLLIAAATFLLLLRSPEDSPVSSREGHVAADALHTPAAHSNSGEKSANDTPAAQPPAPVPPADDAAWARLGSDGFTPDSRALAAALDAGSPLLVRAPDGAAREFLIRPRRIVSDDFQITLGDDRRTPLAAGVRAYEGLHAESGAAMHAAIAGGAFAAEIEEADGATTYLRTDAETGGLRQLKRTREQKRMTCEHNPVTGIASVQADQPPVTEEDWLQAPQAAIEPLDIAASGYDPETTRLDKYVQPIAWGHNYELSLRDNIAIIALDKACTGANTTARLTQITSEYLAKAANLAAIQEDNCGIRYLVQELILTPDDAAYTDVPAGLGDYGSWISGRRPRGTYGWDLSSKFGTGGFSGSTIGLAWVRSLGSTSPVNINQKGYGVTLEAHEQGHNLGSDHSSGGIMNPTINGSRDFFTDVSAGTTSALQIYSHAATRLTGSAVMRHAEEFAWAVDDSVDTPPDTTVDILPLENDRRSVRNGINNAVIRVEEVSRVFPIHAGAAEVTAQDRIRFTPAPGFQGQAWFSYSLRGSAGNGGAGWLHKADIAVQVGAWDRNNLNLRLAPGQEFSFRPSSASDITVISQPAHARVDTARDDRHLIIIRVLATATGTDSFVIQRDGAESVVNLTYVTDFLQTRPDFFTMTPGQASLRFSPMANDQGAGYRNMADVRPIIGAPSSTAVGVSYFPGAFRFQSATLTTPEKGTLTLSTRRFTLNSVSTLTNSGQVTFTPAAGARGVARIDYIVVDAAGITQTNTATIVLPLGQIQSPAGDSAIIAPGHGITLDAAVWPAAEPPLTGAISAQWSVAAAPPGATVTFDDSSANRTGAVFTHAGSYLLRLTLTDGSFSSTDDLNVVVEPSGTGPVDSLMAWWKLDEASGIAAVDASAAIRHGTLSGGPLRAAGVIGSGSLTMDGTDDFVELTSRASAMQSLAQGTISLWFQSNTASLRPIFSMSDTRDTDRYLRIYLESGILKYKVLGDLGTDTTSLASPGTVNDNQWHHAAITVDASRNAKLFLDGELVREGIRPFCNAVFDLNNMAIGRTVRSGAVEYWRGGVDDVRIYSRPLSAGEVLSLARLSANRAPVIALGSGPVTSGSPALHTSVLNPAVTDDGKSFATPSLSWSASGSEGFAFTSPLALLTPFNAPGTGTWHVRLEAHDGLVRTWREAPVTITGNDPGAPWCAGFAPLRVPLGSPPVQVNLHDIFGDPDGADDALTFTVSANTNPSLLSGVSITGTSPRHLSVTFPAGTPGITELTVRATDAGGAFVEGILQITAENFAPVPGFPVLSLNENAPAGTVAGTLAATDPEGAPLRYAITAGNVLDAFALDPLSGVLTVAAPYALDYEARPVFALEVRVSEAAQPSSFTEATLIINLANANEPPVFPPQHFTLRSNAPNGTTAGSLTVSDPEGDAVTLAITAGNTGGAFSLTNGVLTVASSAALNIQTTPRFTLTLSATDNADAPLTATSTVRVTLESTFIAEGSALRWRVPTAAPADGYAWTQRTYSDTTWSSGASGIGYDTNTDYYNLIATDVMGAMYNLQPSLFIRMPFTVSDASQVGRLTLRMKYEDGFWAWINGNEASHHGAPDPVAWNSEANDTRNEDEAVTFRDDDLAAVIPSLVNGSNTLAIQALNEEANSSDLIILPELVWSPNGTAAVPELAGLSAPGLTRGTGPGTLNLRGGVAFTGGPPSVGITVWWGRVDGGTNSATWEHSAQLPGTFAAGWFDHTISALRPATLYYVRYSAVHSGGESWSLAESLTTAAQQTPDFAAWMNAFPGVPAGRNGPDDDADGDGLTNFTEYAFGGNPTLSSDATAQQPNVAWAGTVIQPALDLTWRRRLDATARGLSYELQSASSPAGPWTPSAGILIAGPAPTGDGNTEQVTHRITYPTGTSGWLRVRVTQSP